jgi:hypothetical protein
MLKEKNLQKKTEEKSDTKPKALIPPLSQTFCPFIKCQV